MGCDEFRFKRFTVRQAGAAMKVGTDSVLLGAWCGLKDRPATALDIGTGTGLLALMIAQRSEGWGCRIDAVELDVGAYRQACENFTASPWAAGIAAYHQSIQDFILRGNRYALVIANPPYFENSLHCPDSVRMAARHTAGLPYEELVRCAAASLNDEGQFAVIVPHAVAWHVCGQAQGQGLHLHKRTEVYPRPGADPIRSMMMFGRTPPADEAAADALVIEEGGRHRYSAEYIELTRDFYLKF